MDRHETSSSDVLTGTRLIPWGCTDRHKIQFSNTQTIPRSVTRGGTNKHKNDFMGRYRQTRDQFHGCVQADTRFAPVMSRKPQYQLQEEVQTATRPTSENIRMSTWSIPATVQMPTTSLSATCRKPKDRYQQHNRSPFHINHRFLVRQWSGTVAATSVVFSKFEAHVAKSVCEIQIADLEEWICQQQWTN
jgi:hypothetical protein